MRSILSASQTRRTVTDLTKTHIPESNQSWSLSHFNIDVILWLKQADEEEVKKGQMGKNLHWDFSLLGRKAKDKKQNILHILAYWTLKLQSLSLKMMRNPIFPGLQYNWNLILLQCLKTKRVQLSVITTGRLYYLSLIGAVSYFM